MFLFLLLFLSFASVASADGGSFQCDAFSCLADTPNSYLGETGKCAVVNATETGLEFGACGGTGSVTKVSVVSANGLAGTVANDTTTPAITLSTSITGMLKGNGTAISAASDGTDYLSSSTGLKLDQTTPQTVINGVPKVENGLLIGTDANLTDFPKAKFVSSEGDTGHTYTGNLGVIGEATGGSVLKAVGVGGVALLGGTKDVFGTFGRAKIGATAYTGDAIGVKGASEETHAGGKNVGVYGIATGGATNYSFYGETGVLYNAGNVGIGSLSPSNVLDVNGVGSFSGVKIPTIFTDTNHYSGFPNRTDTTLSFVAGASGATRTLTISGTNWKVFINGVEYTISTTLTKKITDATGLYWFWITAPGGVPQLNGDTSGQTFGDALVATVYWNTTTDAGVVSDERHWMGRDKWNHEYLHQTVGARYYTGGALTFPTSSTFQITQTEIYDEDLEFILSQATTCKVFYKNGSANWEWDTGNTTIKKLVAGAEQYNNGNSLANVSNSNHFAMWVYATNNTAEPFIAILGQRQDVTLTSARANNTPDSISYGALPSAEMKLMYRVIFKQGTTAPIETADYRSVSNLPVTNYTATDHSTLSNLLWTTSGHTGTASTMPVFDSTGAPVEYTMTGSGTVAALQTSPAFLTQISTPSIVTASGALGITPAAGSNLNVSLSTTGDFAVNTNQLYVDTSAGKVGIGTTAPAYALDVNGIMSGRNDFYITKPTGVLSELLTASDSQVQVVYTGSGGAAYYFKDTAAAVDSKYLQINSASGFTSFRSLTDVGAASKELLSFNHATGAVGIGTTSPSYTLDVVGNIRNSENIYMENSKGIYLRNAAGTAYRSVLTLDNSNIFKIGATVGSYITQIYENASALMTLTGGNVGIGTTAPESLLHTIKAASNNTFNQDTYSATAITGTVHSFRRSNSDTLGTHTATVDTDILGTITFLGNSGSAFTNGAYIQGIQTGSASTRTPTNLKFGTSDGTNNWADRMIITSAGNVGIGTTIPVQALDVVGRIKHSAGIIPRVVTAASYTTDTGTSLSCDTADQFQVTAQAGALKFNNPSGTCSAGQKLIIRVKDDGTARALTYDTQFRAIGITLPTTTVISKTTYIGFVYNATDTKWDGLATGTEA